MAGTEPALVVADAGPLIHLDELASLDVLTGYAEILVPDAVWLEVQQHRPQALQQAVVKFVRQPSPQVSARVNAMAAIPERTTLHIRPGLLNEVIAQVKAEWGSNPDL